MDAKIKWFVARLDAAAEHLSNAYDALIVARKYCPEDELTRFEKIFDEVDKVGDKSIEMLERVERNA